MHKIRRLNEIKMTLESLYDDLVSNSGQYSLKLASDGVSGTYFVSKIVDTNHSAVFKDADQDPLSANNPRFQPKLNRFFLGLFKPFNVYTATPQTIFGQSYVADYLAYQVFLKWWFFLGWNRCKNQWKRCL